MSEPLKPARWLFLCCKWALRVHVFGHGFYVAVDRPELFSERYGYRHVYRYRRIAWEFV